MDELTALLARLGPGALAAWLGWSLRLRPYNVLKALPDAPSLIAAWRSQDEAGYQRARCQIAALRLAEDADHGERGQR